MKDGKSIVRDLIVLGGGYGQEVLLEHVYRRFGSFTLFDINSEAPCRRWASHFYNVSIYDYDACLEIISKIIRDNTSIITFATGEAGVVNNRLCEHFGISCRSSKLIDAANNKKNLSQYLRSYGLVVPKEIFIGSDSNGSALKEMSFPAVMKPVSDGGGRNVRYVSDFEEVMKYWKHHRASSDMMLQERLYGEEKMIFLIVRDGKIAVLLHGINIFDKTSGWEGPIGVTIERLNRHSTCPAWLRRLSEDLIGVFDLKNDFIAAELISTDHGDYVIDVEVNALAPFLCSKFMDSNDTVDMLLDTYLNERENQTKDIHWLSAMTYFVSRHRENLSRLKDNVFHHHQYHFEPANNITELCSFDKTVYKGGYIILKDAVTFGDAARRTLEITKGIMQNI